MIPLSPTNTTAWHVLGETVLRYRLDPASGGVDFLPLPLALRDACCSRPLSRPSHPQFKDRKNIMAWEHREKDPLVQLAVRGFPYPSNFSAGESLHDHGTVRSLKFVSQEIVHAEQILWIRTLMRSASGFEALHCVTWHEGDPGFMIDTSVTNHGKEDFEIELLSSFSLADMSPFAADDAPGRLRLHRFRTVWSNEAMHTMESFEQLKLERTWGAAPVFLRYGQTGSMPVRNYFPFIALEDSGADVIWGAQVAWHGSWQMEVYRRDDGVNISGGHGDFERAHWMKRLRPGESIAAPTALVASTQGGIDPLCRALLAVQERLAHAEPAHEQDLPIIFNEWCSTWGKPSHDYLMRTAEKLADTQTRYLVIDDGWAEKPEGQGLQFNGDWNVNTKAFPGGLKNTCDAIRAKGMIPGLWYEFEPCTRGTKAYESKDHLLHRNGRVLEVGNRRFWDFRDPWTFDYLTQKVIHQLRDSGFGYLKVDYNESIGLGCDGADSLGEGLRLHLIKVKEFFAKIRQELPDLVIENCSSGGHREEPGLIALTSMCSFSDAHETVEIPLIAAALHRLVPARKLQIWAVLRPDDSIQRLDYSLVATFLGRMCVSGDVVDLAADKFKRLQEAQSFYSAAVPVLRSGISHIYSTCGDSRRYPTGWQAVLRVSVDGCQALLVVHTFDNNTRGESIQIPLPYKSEKSWRPVSHFGSTTACCFNTDAFEWVVPGDFHGMAWLFEIDP